MSRVAAAPRWAWWCVLLLPLVAAADIPSPERESCRDKSVGEPCAYPGPSGWEQGQCVHWNCRSPGANGHEYPCSVCAAAPGSSPAPAPESAPAPGVLPTADSTPAAPHNEATNAPAEPADRGLPTLLVGITVLAAGVLTLLLRKRG